MLELLLSFAIAMNMPTQHLETTVIEPEPVSIVRKDASQPIINAKSGLVMDLKTGTVLYQKDIYQQLPIASLTKLMTVKVILDENPLNEIATVPAEATQVGGSTMFLSTNEKITIHDLLRGALIQSGNDAAVTLAIHNAGSVSAFVDKMNTKALELDLLNTNFSNPMGFDHPNNYSTAYDLSRLAVEIYKDERIKEIAQTKELKIQSASGNNHSLKNTNALLDSYLELVGLKTGRTAEALGCFVGITNHDEPHLSVVLGSNDRFLDTKILLDWSQNTFEYVNF